MKPHILYLLLFLTSTIAQAQSDNIDNESDKSEILQIVRVKGKSYLSLRKKTNFKIAFDTIELDDNYAFCKKNNFFKIISQKTGKFVTENVRAYFNVGNRTKYYQLLMNNDLIWLDLNSKLSTLKPATSLIQGVCGTVPEFRNIITQGEDRTTITKIEIDESGNKVLDTTIDITKLIGKTSIFFLNNSKRLDFDGNSNFKENLDKSIFFEKLLNGKFNVLKLQFQNPMRKTILVKNIENKYDFSNRTNFFNPFIYSQKKLYGYFPMTLTAKYLFLNPLNINFAKFMLSTGKTGWLDINGIEYLDR